METPALAMWSDLAAAILFVGMAKGWFTGTKLSNYFGQGRSDPVGARRIVNRTEKPLIIAGYYALILTALREGA